VLRAAQLAVAVPAGYLAVLTGAAWVATLARDRPAPTGRTRFFVLVPAHDEEVVIGETTRVLEALSYPADLLRLCVVADHCTDSTVEICRANGTEVLVHDGPDRGKGPALRWAIDELDPDDDDVVVIIDADTIVEPDLLDAFDAAFAAGAEVAQGYYGVRHFGTSASEGFRAAALATRHHLRPLGRNRLGASSGLYGNGMACRASVFRRHGFSAHLTEDMELQLQLLLEGTVVTYVPGARLAAQMPSTLADAKTQNERWERGRLELTRQYLPRLVRALRDPRGTRRVAVADGVLDMLVPPLSVLAAGIVTVGSVTAATALATRGRRDSWLPQLSGLAVVAHVLSALVMVRAPRSVYRALVGAPVIVMWKVRLWFRVLRRGDDVTWIRTAREKVSDEL
jgi:hypothetical protein